MFNLFARIIEMIHGVPKTGIITKYKKTKIEMTNKITDKKEV